MDHDAALDAGELLVGAEHERAAVQRRFHQGLHASVVWPEEASSTRPPLMYASNDSRSHAEKLLKVRRCCSAASRVGLQPKKVSTSLRSPNSY